MGLNKNVIVHRPGPFKQSNKPHKGEKWKSRNKKGKVDVKTITHSKRHELSRQERKHRANQLRKMKRDDVVLKKRGLGGANTPPILVGIISLCRSINPHSFLEKLKESDDVVISGESNGSCHIRFPQLKQRFTFIVPRFDNMMAVLDAVKVVDILLFIHSPEEMIDEYTETILSAILAHSLPTTLHIIQGLEKLNPKKKSDIKKNILKSIESRFPDEKLHSVDTKQDLKLLYRLIGSHKQRPVGFRDARPHLLAEHVEFIKNEDDEMNCGTLAVSGYVRGQPLNVNGLVHIPGWDTFQMSKIVYSNDPYPLVPRKKNLPVKAENEQDEMDDISVLVEKADPSEQESLQSEIIPDPMEGEQTWPTAEELNDALEEQREKIKKKVIEGTSEYQASWIINSDGEEISGESDSESDDDEDVNGAMDDKEDVSDDEKMTVDNECTESLNSLMDPSNYDKNLDIDEERKMLVRFQEERMERLLPDEQDTPADVSARIRFQKYRGLKHFNDSPWDPMESLPSDYARIYRFENFWQTRKKILSTEKEGALPGLYVTLHIVNVPEALYRGLEPNHPLVVYGLLLHEQKISVVNVVIRKHPTCTVPIKSKDRLIFHIGMRRFVCQPMFSLHSTGNKFKYEKFLPKENAVVASFYAPVTFPPASVVVFQRRANGCQELVATGSVLDANPNRVVVKRIVLSGHPFRIFQRFAVVRYMFFNPDDINWFKCIDLYTKCGRKGKIREPLGSHGHMKCVFDKQLQSQDVVLMNLYKRVFLKWTYDPHVPTPITTDEDEICML